MALDPITAGMDLAGKVADLVGRYIPDPAKAAEAALAIQQLAAQERAAQTEVNKAEAASASMFVAGWRPAIGWVCAGALVYQYLVAPLLPWLVVTLGGHAQAMPGLDDNLWQLMLGMLGLGGLRTYEKVQGVATGALPLAQGRGR
jgi:hypothetical protein